MTEELPELLQGEAERMAEQFYGDEDEKSAPGVVDLDRQLSEKERVYVDDPSEAPGDVEVQEGERGGLYYDPTNAEDNTEGIEGRPTLELEPPESKWDGEPEMDFDQFEGADGIHDFADAAVGTDAHNKFIDRVEDHYGEETATDVDNVLGVWAGGGYRMVEELWMAALSTAERDDAPSPLLNREGEVEGRYIEPDNEDTIAALSDLMEMSQNVAEEELGETFTLYRAIPERVMEEYAEVGEDGITIRPQVLESWSVEEMSASPHGGDTGALVEMEWSADDVGFAGPLALGSTTRTYAEVTLHHSEDEAYTIPEENILYGDLEEFKMEKQELPLVPVEYSLFDYSEDTEKSPDVIDLGKERVYIDHPDEAPEDVEVQEGEQGGLYYETEDATGIPDYREGGDHPSEWGEPSEENLDQYVRDVQETEWWGEGKEAFEEAFFGDENTYNEYADPSGDDVTWDDERVEEVHDPAVEEQLNEDAESDEPIGVILMGPPGAGKGWWEENYADQFDREFTRINSDDTKEAIPEYDGTNASEVHEEASHIAKERVAPKAIEENHNVVLDTVSGGGSERLHRAMEEKGYDLRAVFVDVPETKSAHNVVSRYEEEGRFTPLDYTVNARDESISAFTEYAEPLDDEKVAYYSNEVEWGEPPEEVVPGDEVFEMLKQVGAVIGKSQIFKYFDQLNSYGGTHGEAREAGRRRDSGGDSGISRQNGEVARGAGSRADREPSVVDLYEKLSAGTGPNVFEVGVEKAWERYEGPEGGQGWVNTETGEVRYQEEKPDDFDEVEDPREAIETISDLSDPEVVAQIDDPGTLVEMADSFDGRLTDLAREKATLDDDVEDYWEKRDEFDDEIRDIKDARKMVLERMQSLATEADSPEDIEEIVAYEEQQTQIVRDLESTISEMQEESFEIADEDRDKATRLRSESRRLQDIKSEIESALWEADLTRNLGESSIAEGEFTYENSQELREELHDLHRQKNQIVKPRQQLDNISREARRKVSISRLQRVMGDDADMEDIKEEHDNLRETLLEWEEEHVEPLEEREEELEERQKEANERLDELREEWFIEELKDGEPSWDESKEKIGYEGDEPVELDEAGPGWESGEDYNTLDEAWNEWFSEPGSDTKEFLVEKLQTDKGQEQTRMMLRDAGIEEGDMVTLYRGGQVNPDKGYESWTLSLDEAENFARYDHGSVSTENNMAHGLAMMAGGADEDDLQDLEEEIHVAQVPEEHIIGFDAREQEAIVSPRPVNRPEGEGNE